MDNILVGKTIIDMKIASDKQAVLFETTDGKIIAKAYGECCSLTWIEHIELPARGFPVVVISADDIEMPDLGSPNNHECIAYYGFKIITDKGHIIIDYRNESNGYYGGSLSWPGEYYYGGVRGQNDSNLNWVEIDTV